MSQAISGKMAAANAGQTISESKANSIYDEIAIASQSIDDSNVRTESISRRHLVDLSTQMTGEHPTFHQLMSKFQHVASGTYNNTAYNVLSHGGGCTINFVVPVILKPGEALRLQGSVNVTEATVGVDGGGNYARSHSEYYFAFFGDPSGVSTQLSPDFGYSLTSNPNCIDSHYVNEDTSFSDKIQSKFIVQQREAFSYLYINKTGSDITLTNCSIRVKVQAPLGGCTANTIKIQEFRLVAIGVR